MDVFELANLIEDLRIIGADIRQYEVKSNVGKSILETLSAFSNGSGGWLLIGLSESDGFQAAPDFDATKAQNQLIDFGTRLTPRVRPEIQIIRFEGSLVLAAYVEEVRPDQKPCYITERGRYNGSYIRTGDGDSRLEAYEIDRLIEEHRPPQWDQETIPEASIEDFSPEMLTAFLESQRTTRPKTFANGETRALERLGILKNQEVTLAGLLAFGDYPQEFFPRLTVTYAEFPSTTKGSVTVGARLRDKATFTGPIPELVQRVVEKIKSRIRTEAYIDGTFRYDLPDYPLVAVREAITNALMHRDYSPDSRGAAVQVNLFPDRLEIINPGGLYGNVTLKSLRAEACVSSSARNQFLATLLESTPAMDGGIVAENRGTGIEVMRTALKDALMPPPEFKADLSSFTVTFFLRKLASKETHPKVADRVVELLGGVASLSATEIEAALGVSRSAVQKALSALIELGEVEATAPPRSPQRRYRLLREL